MLTRAIGSRKGRLLIHPRYPIWLGCFIIPPGITIYIPLENRSFLQDPGPADPRALAGLSWKGSGPPLPAVSAAGQATRAQQAIGVPADGRGGAPRC